MIKRVSWSDLMRKDDGLEGFDPRMSFGYEMSKRYDGDGRGEEAETVAFLARIASVREQAAPSACEASAVGGL